MAHTFKELTSFIQSIGAAELQHTGDKNYLAHLVAVHNDLKKMGCEEDVCRAGLFHSIYGTERFQRFTLPLEQREEVRSLIGERAERLAYWNCCVDRASLDQAVAQGEQTFVDRITGERIEASEKDFLDLITIHLCDWLEQIERSGVWDYRREGYRDMAELLSGRWWEAYEETYRREKKSEKVG